MRLCTERLGGSPMAVFRTEGALAGEGVGTAGCPQAAAMRLEGRSGAWHLRAVMTGK